VNLRVKVHDDEHGQGVVVNEGVQDVALVVPVLSQVVVAAGYQKSLYKKNNVNCNRALSNNHIFLIIDPLSIPGDVMSLIAGSIPFLT
jgi:hypothetical protein